MALPVVIVHQPLLQYHAGSAIRILHNVSCLSPTDTIHSVSCLMTLPVVSCAPAALAVAPCRISPRNITECQLSDGTLGDELCTSRSGCSTLQDPPYGYYPVVSCAPAALAVAPSRSPQRILNNVSCLMTLPGVSCAPAALAVAPCRISPMDITQCQLSDGTPGGDLCTSRFCSSTVQDQPYGYYTMSAVSWHFRW